MSKTRKIYYRKLVRDNIPGKIKKKGSDLSFKILDQKSFEQELLKKVGEEASGLPKITNKSVLIDELADLIEVIEEIKKVKKISNSSLLSARRKNKKIKGGFNKRIYLVWSSDDGYRANERKGGES